MLHIIYLLLSGLIYSCGSSTKLKVSSDPKGAEIYISSMGGGKRLKFGQTPAEISPDDIKDQMEVTGPILLELELEGYDKQKTLISDLFAVELNLNLNLEKTPFLADLPKVDNIVSSLFEVQKLIKTKEYDKALASLNELKKNYYQLSVLHEIEGGIHFLKGDLAKAGNSYIIAFKFNPENSEALRLLQIVEQRLGQKINRSDAVNLAKTTRTENKDGVVDKKPVQGETGEKSD